MKLVIISGRSGSGKSTALHLLEDLGYYCIDNMPSGLLPALIDEMQREGVQRDSVAISIDARNVPVNLERFQKPSPQSRVPVSTTPLPTLTPTTRRF